MGVNENVGIILGSVYCETFYEKKGITMNKMLSSLYRTALQAGAGIMTGGIILSFVAGGHVSGFLVKLVAVMALVGAISTAYRRVAWEKTGLLNPWLLLVPGPLHWPVSWP